MKHTAELTGSVEMWQFDPDNAGELRGLSLPTGEVVIQESNPLHKAPARAYVPTAFGTHILDPGDWVVLHQSGYVFTLPDAAVSEITDRPATQPDSGDEEVFFAREFFQFSHFAELQTQAEAAGKDWDFIYDEGIGTTYYQMYRGSTGLELGSWADGDAVKVGVDGTVEVH